MRSRRSELLCEIQDLLYTTGARSKLFMVSERARDRFISRMILEIFSQAIRNMLASGRDVNVRKVGTLRLRYGKPAANVRWLRGQKYNNKERVRVKFLASRELIAELQRSLITGG